MQNQKVLFMTQAAMIAAIYVVLTFVANFLGLASGAIQIRFSEALTILPFFIPAAIPGLAIGCLLANFLTGCHWIDIIFGSSATLIGAIFTYLIGKKARAAKQNNNAKTGMLKWLAPLPPIASNAIIIPFVLYFAYGITELWFSFMFVTIGQVISCGILGMVLLLALERRNIFKGK
ncbi:MAG: QueT transporter family protein [Lachnospiraceae bacterium]|nr:QueT transporter family protein [Lachnospiraceae bacterium]